MKYIKKRRKYFNKINREVNKWLDRAIDLLPYSTYRNNEYLFMNNKYIYPKKEMFI